MRLYRKTTQHPFCIYLTAEELDALLSEADHVLWLALCRDVPVPLLRKLILRLKALQSKEARC